MAYKSIYRKWRPMVFEDVVGQSHITETLKNQIKENRVGHAYLFCGTRGTGKTTAAKIFARAVNCLDNKDGSPCNECDICKGILDGSIMDVTEIDAASNNGVDSIRELRDDTKYVTASAKYRIYIIDEVHMLSTSAFNALLKTLEEPPEHVIFILATTEPQQVPQTILSRCQRYDFRRIKPSDIILRLKEIAYGEGFNITEDAYNLIARLGDGSMRDAISVLERVVSTSGNNITYDVIVDTLGIVPIDVEFEIADAVINSNIEGIFNLIGKIMDAGRDINVFMDNLISHFRNLLVCKISSNPSELLDYSSEDIVRFKAMADSTSYERIQYVIKSLSAAKNSAKWIKSPRVIYETAFVKMCVPELDTSSDAVLARISDIEDKIKNGVTVTAVEKPIEKEPEKKEVKKEKVPTRLFNPIPKERLNSQNPIVVWAKKWDKISASVVNSAPYLAMTVSGKSVTVDDDGFIIIFDRKTQMGDKNIAQNQLATIKALVNKATGLDAAVKVAFEDEIDDVMIDIWSLPEPDAATEVDKIDSKSDPLDEIYKIAGDFAKNDDDSDFLTYNKDDEEFSQSEIEDDDDREEFLEEDELKSEE